MKTKKQIRLILRPSKINGVGVFTIDSLEKGIKLPLFSPSDWLYIEKLPKGELKKYCSPTRSGGYYRPCDFNQMSIGWYLNNSKTPNVDGNSGVALRNIKTNEELLINYRILK